MFCFGFVSLGQDSDLLQGDLFFGLWRYGSLYKQPGKIKRAVRKLAKNECRDTLDDTAQDILRIYDVLKEEKLLKSRFVQLRLQDSSVVRIYLDKADYGQIQKYKLDDLIRDYEKVNITLDFRLLGDGLYFCTNLLVTEKIEGQTYQIPRKFAIEDYPE